MKEIFKKEQRECKRENCDELVEHTLKILILFII